MVTYIRSDLEFILAQIKIAEQHAAGQPLYGEGGLVPAYNVSWGLRTVDGSYNHLLPGQEQWGAADQQFPALLDPDYRTAEPSPFGPPGPPTTYTPSNDPASLVFDSSLRTISNLIVDQTLANPAAILEALDRAGGDIGDLGAVTAIYTTFKPFAVAEYQARVVMQNAQAAVDDFTNNNPNVPPSAALQQALDDATAAHAAADAALQVARADRDADLLTNHGITMDGDNLNLPNTSPDGGLSAPFNSWFTLFGQFFDHGLDLVNKGGSGTVFIPLQPDDPLYVEGSPTNFMVLTRATVSAGTDGIMGTADDVGPVNTTTSYVDQNQTYTSHPSHQVFLRQYALNGEGRPVATGKLIEGSNGVEGGMATWGEVKQQALMLGIELRDVDVGSVPLLRTDQYGNFIPDANGYAQVVTGLGADGIPNTADDEVMSGTPGAPVTLEAAVRTNHAFLADIAHTAVPNGIADGDITIGLGNVNDDTEFYDNELLDAHFMAGDGRVNENIGLTAVHHVFHSEHNRLVDHTKSVVLADAAAILAGGGTQAAAVAFLNEWLATDVAAVPVGPAAEAALAWDGERLFQAAKFGTEMQYQHLVFEEFARKIQPQVDFFIVPDGFDTTINPDIVAEFAHVVYRFGHSMLTETIDRYDTSFTDHDIGLIEGFLNPIAFDADHSVADGLAAGDIIRGMTRQVGNEIDEFVTGALRNNLLGLPLDLATINLARGRDTGVPSLNAARREFYEVTNNAAVLKPYESWVDFAGNLKNEASIINFVAAYGTHGSITSEATVEGKRAAAMAIIFGTEQTIADDPNTPQNEARTFTVPADAVEFLNSTGPVWGNDANGVTNTGLDNVDLWIGGLAEKILPFGGMLGSTFNFVFEVQMEQLQNADRFYYLQRLDGLHLFSEMENNSFAAMIMRNTDATHLPSDVFSTPGLILEIDRTKQYNPGLGETAGLDGILEDDPNTAVNEAADNLGNDPGGGSILTPLVIRNNPSTPGPDGNYLRYTGAEHVVLGGTEAADIIISSEGDDAIYGDGGNDTIEGGAGNDIINAGAGDDIVRDLGGDDNFKLGDGNDVVHTGPGLDLVMGGRGQDFIVLGTDAGTEVFAGEGNDFILGNITAERILGNEGDDWIEHGTFDGAPGDNFDEIFARDGIRGNDVFFGLGGFDEFIGEGGDDIMVGSAGVGKMVGMSGFDWATYKDNALGANADLFRLAFDENPIPPPNAALDVYEAVEGLSGSRFNDTLSGSDATSAEIGTPPPGTAGAQGYLGSALDAQGIALITGLQALVGAGVTAFDAGEIFLGGDGSDRIEGRGGNDIIDGDKWLNVRISVRQNSDGSGAEIATADSMTQLVSRMFNGTFNAGQLRIQREILTADGTGDVDTAVYSGLRAEYTLGLDALGRLTVSHTGGTQADGVDTISHMERLQFADQLLDISNAAATGAPTISDTSPTEGQLLSASIAGVADGNGINAATIAYQWQHDAGGGFTNVAGATGATFTPGATHVNGALRVVVSFKDNLGYDEQVVSAATTVVGDVYVGNGGNNIFNGTAGDDSALGGIGADTLYGNAGSDTLDGGTGLDYLDGGTGNDVMRGGAANDTYIVDSAGDVIAGEAVGVLAGAADHVLTSLSAYTLGTNVENLTYTGAGSFTGTGNASTNVIVGGALGDVLAGLNGTDGLDGGDGDDSLDGGGGDDELLGGDGADTLDGGIGNDVMDGGLGNDVYMVNAGGDVVGEDADSGIDTVITTLASYTLGANVENLTKSGGGTFSGTGNTLDNAIIGGTSNNTLSGLAGADTLLGMGGNDSLTGAAGNDSLSGGTGTDTLNGGADDDWMDSGTGNDRFMFAAAFGDDTIASFDANAAGGQDLLNISGLGITAATFGASVIITDLGSDTRVDIGTNSILLLGVTGDPNNMITQTDFILA